MSEQLLFYLCLVLVIITLIMLANKIKVAYPVVLVIAGLLLSLLPGMPDHHLDPDLIFLIFLPPLLYEASWAISWKELWRWRRIISSFAFVVVFLTAFTVALVANAWIPGFSIALGLLLGGIVSPPDAVSAGAILKFVSVPRRLSSILEGESLLNDASSLIIFRFSLIAIGTGQFIWQQAALSFGWMLIGGFSIGIVIGLLFMKVHKFLPTDANMDILLTLVTPYIMYIAAEEAHSSGVLAVVGGGLLLSNKRHQFLSGSSLMRGINVWESLVFALNGFVFLLIGLDLPEITEGLEQEGVSLGTALGDGFLITGVLIVVRIIAAYGAVVTTLIMRNFITVADTRSPGLRVPFLLGWSGMRGVVSLAAALSIPAQLADGSPFPHRNLILFITFVVILSTLTIQGLTLPYLIRKIGLPNYDDYLSDEEAETLLRKGLAENAKAHLEKNYKEHIEAHSTLQMLYNKWDALALEAEGRGLPDEIRNIYADTLQQQRLWLLGKNKIEKKFDEELIRKHLMLINIEEEKLKHL